jgi:hypothetical protein
MILREELEMCKEATVTYLREYPNYLLEGLWNITTTSIGRVSLSAENTTQNLPNTWQKW